MPQPSRLALTAILLSQLVIPLSIAGTAVAMPRIAADLGSNPGPLQWVVNGFNVAFAACTLLWGALADRSGHDRIFRLGGLLVLLASAGSALAPNLLILDLARIAGGIGAAAVLTSATSILSLAWQGDARGRAFALFGTVNGLGLALGPTLCGAITQVLGWRAMFWLPTLTLAMALVMSRSIPPVRIHREEPTVLLDLRILTNRGFAAMVLVPVTAAVGFVTFLTYLPAAFSAIHGWGTGRAGLMMLVATVPVIVAPGATVRIMQRHGLGIGKVLASSIGCLVLGSLAMVALAPGRSVALVIPAMVLVGLGFGLPLGIVDGEALARVPGHASGNAAGILNLVRIGSEALAVAGYSALLTMLIAHAVPDRELADSVAAGQPGMAREYASAQHWVALVCAVVVALLGLAIWGLSRARVRHEASQV